MIRVTRLNGEQFALNPDLIERVEGHPDTVVFLVDGTKYIVRESVEEVLAEIREYRASILATAYEMDRAPTASRRQRRRTRARSCPSRPARSADPWTPPPSSASASRWSPWSSWSWRARTR